MSFLSYIPILGNVLDRVLSVVDNSISEKEKLERIKSDIIKIFFDANQNGIAQQAQVLTSEIKGQSWLQRNWRPSIMLLFGYIIFNNYILAPYVGFFFDKFPVLPIPDDLWDLLKLGIGGYICGRSAEKIADKISTKVQK